MKSKNNLAVRVVVVAAIALSAAAARADRTCAHATLRGSYVFTATGAGMPRGTSAWQPKAILEVMDINGDGTLVASATIANRAGDGLITTSTYSPGQYQLDPMCTGSLAFADGPKFNIVVDPSGDQFWLIQTNDNNVFQGSAKRLNR